MKRILSLLLLSVTLLSMFVSMTTTASANALISTYENAKNGDLLYELKFGQSAGAYIPSVFRATAADDVSGAITVTDNGRTLTFKKTDSQTSMLWYGGKIDGLTWGGDKVYTMTMKVNLPSKRAGVYFNFPNDAKLASLSGGNKEQCTYSSVLYGVYGKFDNSGDMGAVIGGSRINGNFKFSTFAYQKLDEITVAPGTFLELTYLIEGYSYAVFINGVFIDVIELSEGVVRNNCDNLGFSTYLFWQETMTVKDVNIYKGDTVSAKATYPEYAKEYKHYRDANSTTETPTTPAETTPAETTTAPAETTTKSDLTTTSPNQITTAPDVTTTIPIENKGGCSSAVTSGVALIALASLAGVTVAKKRK